MEIKEMMKFLTEYDGRDISLMEVCGSHTAAIVKSGIRQVISQKIHLISGPGCPVCVTPSAYIDRLIDLAKEDATTVVTFGDLMRVPGSVTSLGEARSDGADVLMVYSPLDVISIAKDHPEETYIFAALGFETTIPVYAVLLDELQEQKIENVKLLTSLKTMIPALELLCMEDQIDGFIAPGHVSVIIGSDAYQPLAKKHKKPFAVAGFSAEELVRAIYGLVQMTRSEAKVYNFYPSVVKKEGNPLAIQKMNQYFEKKDAAWRGLGMIEESGLYLKAKYAKYDAGSKGLSEDQQRNKACACAEVLKGRRAPKDCPLFGKVCTPLTPQGACMVSEEGSCAQAIKEVF